jgi:hypothetical protein
MNKQKEMLEKIIFHNQNLTNDPSDLTDEETGMFREFWTILDRELEIAEHQKISTSPVEDFHREWDHFFTRVMRVNDEFSHIDDKKVDEHLKDLSNMVEMLQVYWEIEKRSY